MAAVPHVVVITFPFASHAVKLFRLARALAAVAPAANFSFLSTAGSLAQLQEKNQHAALEGNLRFVQVPDGLSPSSPTNHMARLGLFLAAAEAGAVKEALETASASAGGARVTCVVGDAFVWMAAEAAAAVEAPWVPVWTGGPSALLAHLCGDALRGDIGDKAASRADELLTSHPGLGSYRVRDLPDGCVFGEMHVPIVALFRRVAEHLPRAATAVALNTFPGLLPDDVTAALAAELPECLPVGPFHLLPVHGDDDAVATDPYGCLAWLDGHRARAVAYASFGTVVTAVVEGQEELRELAAGLEASGAPFLWSLPKEYWSLLPTLQGYGAKVPYRCRILHQNGDTHRYAWDTRIPKYPIFRIKIRRKKLENGWDTHRIHEEYVRACYSPSEDLLDGWQNFLIAWQLPHREEIEVSATHLSSV